MNKILKYCFNTSSWSPTKSEWINLLASLPNNERENVKSYMFKNNSKQSLIGQILIRYCLKSLLNIDWSNLVVERNSKGRPFLKLKETLSLAKLNNIEHTVDFNVSHSGDYVIIAAGIFPLIFTSSSSKKSNEDLDENTSCKIGTDVMKIDIDHSKANNSEETNENIFRRELERHERVINSKFTNAEKNYIYNRPNPVESLTAFYRLWCLKESYVKAIGDGIGFDLQRIECQPNSELLIDLNSKKHIVASDSQLFVDSKLIKTCKYYEQYYMNNLSTNSHDKNELHIMTLCLVEKENKSKEKSSQSKSISLIQNYSSAADEFIEISIKDILNEIDITSIDNIDEKNAEEYENIWQKFCSKQEKP